MPDADLNEDHLSALEKRWEQEPDSRIYLQLAEEYRKHGRQEKAVEVLEQGLERRPRDLSAMVALGRCRLELGEVDSALTRLEGVIDRDPAHMVANKLLVEVYLQKGDLDGARSRLEIYRLLNDRDPEIEALESRLRGAGRGAQASAAEVEQPRADETEQALEAKRTVEAQQVIEAEPEPAEEVAAGFPIEAPSAPTAVTLPLIETAAAGALFALGDTPSSAPNFDLLWRQTVRPHEPRNLVEPFAGLETTLQTGEDPAAVFPFATEAQAEPPVGELAAEGPMDAAPIADQEEPFVAVEPPSAAATDPSEEDTLRLPAIRPALESEEAAELLEDEVKGPMSASSEEPLPVVASEDDLAAPWQATGPLEEKGLPEDTAPIDLVEALEEPALIDGETVADEALDDEAERSLEDDDTMPFTVSEPEPLTATEVPLLETAEFSPQAVLAGQGAEASSQRSGPPATDEDTAPIAAVSAEEPFSQEVLTDATDGASAVGDHDTSPLPAVSAAESRPAVRDEDTTPIDKMSAESSASEALAESIEGSDLGDLEEDAPRPIAPRTEGEAATATLGQLYLEQGHFHEAEQIFKRVLQENASSQAALIGLRQVARHLEGELTAEELLLDQTAKGTLPEGLTAKKILVLEGYLKQLRGMGQSHVQ